MSISTVTADKQQEAYAFYKEVLTFLNEQNVQYMVGGAFAFHQYTGIIRDTKDLDIFCRPEQFPGMLKLFAENGFVIELTDARWLAKIFRGDYFTDLIFNSSNGLCAVDDSWFARAVPGGFEGVPVMLTAPEEMIWTKLYIQNRERFDGADVNHLLLCCKELNWEHLLHRMGQHWQLLLAQLLVFQFVYPADFQEVIPQDIFNELVRRTHEQFELPASVEKICRGPLIDQTQYAVDVLQWKYKAMTHKTI